MILSKNRLIVSLLMTIFTPFLTICKNPSSLIGQEAPNFGYTDQNGNQTTLAQSVGTKKALIFYPKNESYYCTQQLCSVSNNQDLLKQNNIIAIGISPNSEQSHESFIKNKNVSILLVSDPKKEIAKLYHATGGWFGYNKRITVLIDENNKVISVIDNVNVSDHPQQILDGFHENN